MKVNPIIRQTFKEIAAEAVKSANEPIVEHKKMSRLLRVFMTKLSEEEKLYIFSYIMINMHYKNLLLDDDQLLKINNIKLRTVMFIFLLTCIFFISAIVAYKQSELVSNFGTALMSMLGLIFSLD
jgi:hypothetical protein